MDDPQTILLTLTQALHLVAFAPCILVVFYLLATTQHPLLVFVPILFFAFLAFGVAIPLTTIFSFTPSEWENSFYLSDLLLPVLSFLLITQFFLNRIPPFYYWFALFVPIITGFPAIDGLWNNNEVCLSIDVCIESIAFLKIAYVITGSLVMMLITATLARMSWNLDLKPALRAHKYWLIIAIIAFNLYLLLIELGSAANWFDHESYLLSKIIIKLAFVYLILTSIFRVYAEAFAVDEAFKVTYHRRPIREDERKIASDIIRVMDEEKPFIDNGFNRGALATTLNISEHQLSRIVNICFRKTVSDLLNEYRIKEAKKRLSTSDDPITNIAFDVGFNSIASFNRVFKQQENCSPTQYREQYKL